MCGPSSSEKAIQASSQSFGTQMQANYGTLFAQQQDVLKSINRSLNPVVSAGPSQRGFSSAETSALQTKAINDASAATRNAQQAARTYGAGEGGGASSGITSGITKQIEGAIASQGAQAEGAQLNQIESADWNQGNQNYWRAQGALQGVAGLENPNATAGTAVGANNAAFQQASQISTENNALGQDIAGFASAAIGAAPGIIKGFKG
jgi:hypothetical protein